MRSTIKHQDAGDLVKAAQLLIGYALRDGADGQYSASFVARVLAWQGNHGLTPDGVIGPATWKALADAAPTCSTAKNRISAATQALQLLLEGANLTPDGVFGPRTRQAVAAFQASAGLDPDGICGPKTWSALIVGVEAAKAGGAFVKPVDYKQGDSRWGKKMYSNHGDRGQTMANSGCGPTAMADAVAKLVNSNITPWTLAELAMEWGDRTYSSGTAVSFFKHIQQKYGFKKMVSSTGLATVKACLDAGGYVVCRMGPGYWTRGGHYICAWMYDSGYIYCCDPASSVRKQQKLDQFLKERKDFWCFWPERD